MPATQDFFRSASYGVVGASTDRSKFGNTVPFLTSKLASNKDFLCLCLALQVLRWYMDRTLPVQPINPKASEIEGLKAIKSLRELSSPTSTSVSVITPPSVTLSVLKEAEELGVPSLWLQPGQAAR